jgi:hypothetical protein
MDIDMALRHAAEQHMAAVLLPASRGSPSTARIADRLRLPAIAYEHPDPFALAYELERPIMEPQVARAEALLATARAMRRADVASGGGIAALRRITGTAVGVVNREGVALFGDELALPLDALGEQPRVVPCAEGLVAAAPVKLPDSPVEAWVVAGPFRAGAARSATTVAVLELAAAPLAGDVARRRLVVERDAHLRSALLGDVLALAGPPPAELAQRMVAAGWSTSGWHVGLQLLVRGATEIEIATETPRIVALLERHGFAGPVVHAAGGWTCWRTAAEEPEPMAEQSVLQALRALVREAGSELVLHVGVGTPRPGIQGLAQTVVEARRASILASASGPRSSVEHAGVLASRQLLLGWSGSEPFRAHAERLLDPLLQDGATDLLRTVEVFLECESSTVNTAATLRVHRNTVSQRLQRVERLLGVNLADADERLTLQIAIRVVRMATASA